MNVRVVALAALVALAGCAGVAPDSSPSGEAATPTVDPDNHWRAETLSVAVETPAGDDRDYRPLVRTALDYWTDNAEQYAGYPISFRLVSSPSDADLVVAFVPEIDDCGGVADAAGCAPYLTSPGQVDRPVRVEVLTGLADDSTELVVKHELGHVLGLGHDDDPAQVMSGRAQLATLPKRNATDREFPWRDGSLTVYVDYANLTESGLSASDRSTVERQVERAVDYYDRGADGQVPENASVRIVDDRDEADVVVEFATSAPCSAGDGSCGYRYGTDPDRDGALEWYTRARVALAGIDAEAVGWHVGYWLGYAVGFTEDGDWPAVFRNASAEQRRSDWWADADAAVVPLAAGTTVNAGRSVAPV